ncbi:MAG: hypothetical protein KGL35_12110, partial [Bradyrhizobium sp.]|nr:hypothetical protein [Bradyrhizobium sp.]
HPLSVFDYYAPGENRYADVRQGGAMSRESPDAAKVASARITIEAEIRLPELAQRAVDWVMARLEKSDEPAATNTGDQSAATNTGDQSAAINTGYRSAATNTGGWSAATNTGDQSAATNTGYRSAATNTGGWSAATNTGDQSAAINTGCRSAADVSGAHAVALASGHEGKARASDGSAIVLVNRDAEGAIRHIRCGVAGRDVKPDVWYRLGENGEFVEVAG